MGFGERWCRWIKWCLSTVRYSVMVNGSPTGFFQSSRGLRQGDPLSPYLFVVVMEAFSVLIKKAVAGGFLAPCLIWGRRGERVQISHLLFADDTLIFCEAKEDQLLYMSWLLMWFEAISGLRVNLEKSELIPVGRVENVDELADEFGYRVGKPPSTYLGMPLGAPFKSVVAWDGIEERFRKKLAMWKRQYISKGGRITLVRNTLANLPIYFMSIFQMPRVVRIRLEKIQRDFLWGGGALVQKPHLVWSIALWNQVIRGKYGEERGGWRSCESREAYGFGLWKAITSNKEAWVNEVWTAEGEWGGSWNPCFNRPFNDWELEEVERLFCCLEGKKVRGDEEDKVKWMASKDGDFSVKSLYRTMQLGSLAFFPSKIIWNSCVQPKLSFFAWEASWGRVLTLDRLQKRVLFSVQALKTGSFSTPQPTPQTLPSTSVATGPALPQHLPPVHPYSQPGLPLGHFANMIGYPFLPQSYTYMPSAYQQAFAGNSTYHQSLAAVLPQYKNSVSVSSLPQSAAIASGYGAFGSSTSIPGNFSLNPPTAAAGTTIGYDDVINSQYKDGNHLISLQQQNENSAMWVHGPGSRTMSAVPANTYYSFQGQNQQPGGFRQGQQPSSILGPLGTQISTILRLGSRWNISNKTLEMGP
ncbi:LINE-1 reverse transcriptase-like [Vitis vinifera]|uniref:LINE-1 reverse transcriptase-like n=1 Tax=Vitis vinifera TaxID=29760 RepID=A0A438JPJ4_VITVI|nr:LINE-1 reverse transcriptase-like [Vitis vinifera]